MSASLDLLPESPKSPRSSNVIATSSALTDARSAKDVRAVFLFFDCLPY
jgi:hypothetical protein